MLSPRVVLGLAAGFAVLFLAGYGLAQLLSDATPVWSAEALLDDPDADHGISPRAMHVDADGGGVDARVATGLADSRPDWLVRIAGAVSWLAKIWVVGPLVALVGLVVWLRTRRTSALWLPALAGAGGLALSVSVKMVTYRPRPPEEVAVVEAFGPSYPSGHVIRAIAVYGAFAWLVSATSRSRRAGTAAWGVVLCLATVIGVARVVEGAHWLTDVLASYALGTGWLVVVLAATGLLGRQAAGGRQAVAGRVHGT